MYALIIIPLIPLYGWWLYRQSRPLRQLVTVVNNHDVDLGFMTWNGKTHELLLFSDVTFVFWLLRKKYLDVELPRPVTEALDEARRAYLAGLWQNLVIIVLAFVFALA
jgi:hypothetical protein